MFHIWNWIICEGVHRLKYGAGFKINLKMKLRFANTLVLIKSFVSFTAHIH